MRTAIIIVGGLVLFGVFVLVARFAGGTHMIGLAAKIFIPVWLVAALINLWIGVARAGYSVAEELPIFLLIFAVPAVVAAFTWWKLSSAT
jgi:uncharacterized membrane protein YoaK (UPF0700 family)